MNHLPFHTAHHWITRLTQLPHPITINHIPPLAADLNWKPTGQTEEYYYSTDSEKLLIQTPYDIHDDQLFSVSFSVAWTRTKNLKEATQILDIYHHYFRKCCDSWGNPSDYTTNPTSAIWKFNNHSFLQVDVRPESVSFSFETIDPNGKFDLEEFGLL